MIDESSSSEISEALWDPSVSSLIIVLSSILLRFSIRAQAHSRTCVRFSPRAYLSGGIPEIRGETPAGLERCNQPNVGEESKALLGFPELVDGLPGEEGSSFHRSLASTRPPRDNFDVRPDPGFIVRTR